MKKRILSLAMVAVSLVSFPMMAQNTKSDNAGCASEECVHGKDFRKMKKGGACPFEGLDLSDAQKTQLQQLDQRRMTRMKEQAETGKAEKLRNDSIRRADRIASKKAYLEEVKAILGAEKYVRFLENAYLDGAPQGHPGKMGKPGDRRPDGGRFGKHMKGDKPGRPVPEHAE